MPSYAFEKSGLGRERLGIRGHADGPGRQRSAKSGVQEAGGRPGGRSCGATIVGSCGLKGVRPLDVEGPDLAEREALRAAAAEANMSVAAFIRGTIAVYARDGYCQRVANSKPDNPPKG